MMAVIHDEGKEWDRGGAFTNISSVPTNLNSLLQPATCLDSSPYTDQSTTIYSQSPRLWKRLHLNLLHSLILHGPIMAFVTSFAITIN